MVIMETMLLRELQASPWLVVLRDKELREEHQASET